MIEDTLAQIGLILPEAAKPTFAYAPVTLHDGVAYVSGQLPKIDGEVKVFGKVGREVTLDTAREEGLLFDPITGRAFGRLMDTLTRDARALGTRVCFIHTGGLFGLFPHRERLSRLVDDRT